MDSSMNDEMNRLESLHTYEILDTLPESIFDDITLLASQICETPIALISFVDSNRQWFKSRLGLEDLETPRNVAFCDKTIRQNGTFTVNDASADDQFSDNALVVGGPKIRFYSGAVLKSPTGAALGSLCVIDTKPRELSANQKAALEALSRQVMQLLEYRRMQMEYRKALLITDNIPAHIVYFGHDWKIKFANAHVCHNLGLSPTEIFGRPIESLVTPEQFALRRPIYQKALEGHPQVIQVELLNKNKELMVTKNVLTPDFDEQGRVKGVVVIGYDQTAEETLKKELLDASLEADTANAAKSAFLANMSHEIRSPLGAMMGFVELMRDGDLSAADHREYLDIVSRNATQVTSLIDDILDLSKVEAGKIAIEAIEFSLEDLLLEFTAIAQFRAKENGIEFHCRLSPSVPHKLVGDPTRIKQILNNVVGNAIKFTQNGIVELDVSLEESLLSFRVTDSGIGISASNAKGLFEPFHQADATMTRKFGGTGLGLVLTRKLSRLMGGDFTLVRSEPGVGSVFAATIKIDQTLAQNNRPTAKNGADVSKRAAIFADKFLSPFRILIVDDAADNLLLIKTLLKRWGAEIDTAEDGSEGAEKALSGGYDLVVMDVQMPRVSGHEAVKQMRAGGCRLPVVALTAHAMADEKEKCLQSGYTDFLSKPIDREEMQRVLKRCLAIPFLA